MGTHKVRNRFGLVNRVKLLLGEGRLGVFSRPAGGIHRAFATAEPLEPRTLLATDPYLSEFMANNDNTLVDEDGDHPGWIEIANAGVDTIDLKGYHLTDDKADLDKWEFPAATIDGGGYLVVFAAKDQPGTGTLLHTNFKLDDQGEYLALVAADGTTVVSAFDPKYPTQKEDISYGIATDMISSGLLPAATPLKVRIPANGSLGSTWEEVGFNDASWRSGTGGVGFDLWTAPPPIAGFTVKMADFNGDLNNITTAQQILDGPMPPGYTLQSQATKDYQVVNHGPGGDFVPDESLPDGQGDGETYALRCTADVVIPSGTWTFDVGSDDGFMLTIPGVEFDEWSRFQEDYSNVGGGVIADRLVYSQPRGHNHTSASFTVPTGGLKTTLTLDFYENGGGDDVELSIAPGQQTFNASFVLLSDGVLPGWSVTTTSSAPPPDYRPLIQTNVQTEMLNHNASAYIRIPLKEVLNPADFDLLRLRVKYDDGFVAYLNGQRIAWRNAPPTPVWDSAALQSRPDTQAIVYEDIDITLPDGLLKAGVNTNVLAIQAMNESAGEEDFLFSADLLGLTILAEVPRYFSQPTPGRPNAQSSISEVVADTNFSHPRGFYDQAFMLAIECGTQGAEVRYTLDGTVPTATTGTVFVPGQLIPIAGTTTVRAAAFKPGAIATNVDTETYLFTSDVVHQSASGQAPAGWPASWSPNTTDYGMDPDVVNSPLYAGEIEGALKSIPTFSIVMNVNDLFGPTGIYSYAGNDGRSWERPVSVELIYPDGTQGFQTDAGIRIRGGFSRDSSNPKHAFRLFFRDEYGNGKLNYPLFGEDGAQSFDNIDLRTFQNYSWSFQGDSRGIFIRDQLNRDMQLAMGDPATRGNYYHLYINGQYWGLYDTEERPEASFGATYFGGDKEEYDVIKQNGGGIIATDGNMLAWTDLWNQIKGDLTSNANYMRLQGLNPDGTRNSAYSVLLDVNNLIDYMLVIFWGGNFDSPLSWFMGETGVNNFYAMRNRNGTEGFRFFIHDAEHTLVHPNSTDVNVYLNADRTGPLWQNPDPGLGTSNPQYMWQYLAANTEFRTRVADRMNKFFHNGGVLTAPNVTAMFEKRISEIYGAVVGESARWGDAKRGTPFTRDAEWLAEVNKLRAGYLPYRSDVVFDQLQADGFYPDVAAPVFSQFGGTIALPFTLTITNSAVGQVYYTLDGSDPRTIGGGLGTTAKLYTTAGIKLTGNMIVKARIKVGEEWSALTEATFYNDLSALRVTEIMYDPAPGTGTTDAQEYEFIELQNTGAGQIDLTGVSFTAGIDYEFAIGTKLASQQRIVVVKNPDAFAERYPGVTVLGFYPTKYLDNNGDRLTITGPGGVLLDFKFKDWYDVTKGQGYALVAIDPAAPLAQYGLMSNWRTGDRVNGGPGLADPGTNPDAVVINEVMTNTTGADGDWIELYNTTDQEINIGGWYLSNDPTDLTKYRIAVDTKIPAYDFVVFTENGQFGNPADAGVRTTFSLSRLGDDVLLSSNDGSLGVGGYRDAVDFGASAPEVTFGRYLKSTGGKDITALSAPTRRMPNAAPAVGPVIISEVMYHPIVGHEFIELQNLTGADFPLYDTAN
ncbi:MAG: lamin tail domain-containing protein, partial [Planctomycetota bacterium]|nr:lamin tail domain-containing protein [Planctomycetota bacterium]